jgi:hypothetical protein
MIIHLGIPNWHYAFTKAGLDPQTLQWFRFFIPERLAIDIENRKYLEQMNRKKQNQGGQNKNQQYKFPHDKIKIEGLKRRKRRMRLRGKNGNEEVIEKFAAHSSKTAKYGKTSVKKREASELRASVANDNQSFGGGVTVQSTSGETNPEK